MKKTLFFAILLIFTASANAQFFSIEGYVFEEGNRGYLNEVQITVFDKIGTIKAEVVTNRDGFFKVEKLQPDTQYKIRATKDIFHNKEVTILPKDAIANETGYVKMEMQRQPGYLFDVTLSESEIGLDNAKESLRGSTIEIFNNTTFEEALVLKNHTEPFFQFTFEQGNHYTVMIRKKGYLTKRLEARVNVDGCILCFEGIGNIQPNITDNLTEGNQMGTLLANIELDRIELNRSIKIENIYYDLGKWNLRAESLVELDKVITLMKNNPGIIIELGSHTDSRGSDESNKTLSQKRAESAVGYIINEGGIDNSRIRAKGYGETLLINECADGVNCSEAQHQLNRRTEIKITDFLENIAADSMSLRQIIYEEKMNNLIYSTDEPEVIKLAPGEDLPEEILRDIEKSKNNTPASTSKPNTSSIDDMRANNDFGNENATSTVTGAISSKIDDSTTSVLDTAEETTPPPSNVTNDTDVTPSFVRKKAKPVPFDFNGYKIQIMESDEELASSHKIFSQHGSLNLEKLPSGKFGYLLGSFKEESDAQSFLGSILSSRYPDAKVIEYKDGKRTSGF